MSSVPSLEHHTRPGAPGTSSGSPSLSQRLQSDTAGPSNSIWMSGNWVLPVAAGAPGPSSSVSAPSLPACVCIAWSVRRDLFGADDDFFVKEKYLVHKEITQREGNLILTWMEEEKEVVSFLSFLPRVMSSGCFAKIPYEGIVHFRDLFPSILSSC